MKSDFLRYKENLGMIKDGRKESINIRGNKHTDRLIDNRKKEWMKERRKGGRKRKISKNESEVIIEKQMEKRRQIRGRKVIQAGKEMTEGQKEYKK